MAEWKHHQTKFTKSMSKKKTSSSSSSALASAAEEYYYSCQASFNFFPPFHTPAKTQPNWVGGSWDAPQYTEASSTEHAVAAPIQNPVSAVYDQRSATELLSKIRHYSSPYGDGTERVSNLFSTRNIAKLAEKATTIHVIDFGIGYGFQWPCLIQRLSTRTSFRAAEIIKVTGRRLRCCERMLMLRNLPDDSVMLNSPRNMVLKLIKKINPDLFIHGVVNGTERIDRPETYKQWQLRNKKAGFRQLPLEQKILKRARTVLKSDYHKDFDLEVDGRWMLQGWKGRVIHALSCWKPVQD
ncbi:hypothetical protein F3Y22_tig00116997pilonHSYRG00377 [Hibiscus syriacus]|uniref:Uncharacterized protein n=1 Tax=Hibiscus syriacus TaxID=106335 RepID=A0A6A2XSB8_HIBSY|nr:hypothetical protein F3Y22_tig00116997pilonHSYRG00377 [Hibiscus syriacus]